MREGTALALKNLGALDAIGDVTTAITTLAHKHRASGSMNSGYFQALQDVSAELAKLMAARRKEKS